MPTPRQMHVLSALAAGRGAPELTPVQAQKLFFLLDREGAHLSGGPWFNSHPYDYGPFDIQIYQELDALSREGYVEVDRGARYRKYRLTPRGLQEGMGRLRELSGPAVQWFGDIKNWVQSLNFNDLVTEIYRKYPEMRENSVFRR